MAQQHIHIPNPVIPSQHNRAELEENSNYNRKEAVRKLLHSLFLWFLKIVFLLAMIILCCRIFHLIAPATVQWLSAEQIQNIDKILLSGTLGSLLGKYYDSAK